MNAGLHTWCHISRPESALSAQPCWSTRALLAAAVNHTPDAHSLCNCPAPHPEYLVNHLFKNFTPIRQCLAKVAQFTQFQVVVSPPLRLFSAKLIAVNVVPKQWINVCSVLV